MTISRNALISGSAVAGVGDELRPKCPAIQNAPGNHQLVLVAINKSPGQEIEYVRFGWFDPLGDPPWNIFQPVFEDGDASVWQLPIGDMRSATESEVFIKFSDGGKAAALCVLLGWVEAGESPVDALGAATFGKTATPSTQPTAARSEGDFTWSLLFTDGPVGDNPGAWQSPPGTSAGLRAGTSGNGAAGNRTIQEGYSTWSSAGTDPASISGITPRAGTVALVAYKHA